MDERGAVGELAEWIVAHGDADEFAASGLVCRVIEVEPAIPVLIVKNIRRPHPAAGVGVTFRLALPMHEVIGNENLVASAIERRVKIVLALVANDCGIGRAPRVEDGITICSCRWGCL